MNDDDVEIIMPLTINKYHGSVVLRTDCISARYKAIFTNDVTGKRTTPTFDTFEKGFEWIKHMNELEGNTKVKNIICRRGEEY